MDDANATQRESDLALLQRLIDSGRIRSNEYKAKLTVGEAATNESELLPVVEAYKDQGGDTGAIKQEVGALVPPVVAYSATAPLANAITPNIPVAPTVTPSKVLPNVINGIKNAARVAPVAMAMAEPATALMTGRYEKGKAKDEGIFGDGYDFSKHGLWLGDMGIPIDVGRVPYYFNRSMHDMVVSPIKNLFTPDPDPGIWLDSENNGVPMPELPESTRSEKPAPMPDITELLQSGIY